MLEHTSIHVPPAVGQLSPADHLSLAISAAETAMEDEALYGEWQIKPSSIIRWKAHEYPNRVTGISFLVERVDSDPIVDLILKGDILNDVVPKTVKIRWALQTKPSGVKRSSVRIFHTW